MIPSEDTYNRDLLTRIPRDSRAVLDVGCGTGALGLAYRRLNPNALLLGIERDPTAAETARSSLDQVASVDVERQPWPFAQSSVVDCIIYGDVLQQLTDPEAVLNCQIEHLNPNGTVLACVPNAEHWTLLAHLLRGTWGYQPSGLFDAAHLRWFSRNSIVRFLGKVGLTVEQIEPRIFDAAPAKAFADLMLPGLGNLGIDVTDYIRRSMPLQYVVCCRLRSAENEVLKEQSATPIQGPPLEALQGNKSTAGSLEGILRSKLSGKGVSDDGPVIHVNPAGNLGTRMIQAMTALNLAAQVPGARLSNISLPEWGLISAPIPHGTGISEATRENETRLDVTGIAERLRSGALARYEIQGDVRHYDNFIDRTIYDRLFQPGRMDVEVLSGEWLAISIRSMSVLEAPDPDYTLLPVAFYKQILGSTGLKPAFIGRIANDSYGKLIRQEFPNARYVASHGVLHDFELLRRASNIVVSVSVLSWLSSWLSEAQLIVLPLTGVLNPCQAPLVDLLPLDDPRYQFHLFPVNYAVAPERVEPVHRALSGLWRQVTPAMIKEIRARRPRFGSDLESIKAHFDSDYYLTHYPEVAAAIETGKFQTALDHWLTIGIRQQRSPFALDRTWYGLTYPLAALEVGQGDFTDFHHHWVAVGRYRGYRRLPA